MICPVELASEMSAFQAGHGRGSCRRGHEALQCSRRGAGDEGTRSDFARLGEANQLVAGSRDSGSKRPADATVEKAVREIRVRRAVGSEAGEAESASGGGGGGRAGT